VGAPAGSAGPEAAGPGARSGEAAVLALLTGPDVPDLLGHVLGTAGVVLADHVVHAVQHRPGDGVTVGYRVWVRGVQAAVDAPLVEEYVLVSSTSGRDVPDDSPGLVRLEGSEGRLLAWRHPHDPALPALGTACDPPSLQGLLPGAGPVTELELVGYRPLRRAVLRAVRDGTTTYVKVLRPGPGRGAAADVLHRHVLLADAGLPVPRVLTTTADGLVVLERAPGIPLVEAIGTDEAAGLDVRDLVGVLDQLPSAVLDLPRRPAWSDRARTYADAVAASGRWADTARDLGRAVRRRSRTVDLGPVVATHGDFHEGQLTVRRGTSGWAVAALLDVDTVGPGHRVDDLACLLAHAVALGPQGQPVARRWERQAGEVVDPAALAVRTAGVLLSLAAGAVHQPDPAAADALIRAAHAYLDGP
jgi:hypothetical protein